MPPCVICRRRLLVLLGLVLVLTAPMVRSVRGLNSGPAADLVLGHPALTDGTVNAKQLSRPMGSVVDPTTGMVFVADSANNRVLRFASPARFENGAAAEGVLGQPDLTSSAQGTSAQGMSHPSSVVIDSGGRLWVVDEGNSRVLRFDNAASKPNGAPADGVLGQGDFTSSTQSTSAQGMYYPRGAAVDASGTLWVADTFNSRVLRFDTAASKSSGALADGVLGQAGFTSRADATTAQGMHTPAGVSTDAGGRIWVADAGNNRVLRFDTAASKPSGAPADGVLGQGDFTSSAQATSAQGMRNPFKLSVDGSGRLWVADEGNSRVLRFDNAASQPNGTPANSVLGQSDLGSATQTTSAQGLYRPSDVALDGSGTLWVADTWNNRVLRFDNAASKPSGAPADGVQGNSGFDTKWFVAADLLQFPQSVAIDPTTGKVFIADTFNNRVLRFAARTSLSSGTAAEAVLGQSSFASTTVGKTAQGMWNPIGVTVDADGRLWVADDFNNRVLRFDNAASKPSGAPADGVLGQPDFTSTAQTTTAQGLWNPSRMALDTGGRLWVVDTGNSRVLRFDNAASKPNGAPADGVLGQLSFTERGWKISAWGMWAPAEVVADASGHIWVADKGNYRVLRFDNAAGKPNGAPADGVLGQAYLATKFNTTSASGMSEVAGLAVDKSGRLWVADTGNNRVLRFDNAASKPNGAPADAVLGQTSFTARAAAATAQGFSAPWGLAIDEGGRLWVADSANNRVLLFEQPVPLIRPQIYLPLARR